MVEDGAIGSVPFQKALLVKTNDVVIPATMEQLLQNFTANEIVDHVSSLYFDSLCDWLESHTKGRGLYPSSCNDSIESWTSTIDQFPVGSRTKTVDNHPPVTVQDKNEIGMEHQLQMFKVDNSPKINVLHKQLPALQSGGSYLGHPVSMQSIAASTEGMRIAFVNNTNQRRIDVETRNRPTTFGEKYPHFLDHFLKLCDVEREEDLPVIWHQMANQRRDSELFVTLLQTKVASEVVYFGQLPMCTSVPHKLSLKNFKLDGNKNNSNIDTGYLPFTVIPTGATLIEATTRQDKDQDVILYYAIVHEGNGNELRMMEIHEIHQN